MMSLETHANHRKYALQRHAAGSRLTGHVPSIVQDVLAASGRPLDVGVRAFMEPRFGHDFSRVRIHTDAQAAKSAVAVGALAFTVGNHVVFGANQFNPGSQATRSLLAHELTHVVQQSRPGGAAQGLLQRWPAGSGAGPAGLRQEYIQVACEVIAEIQRGVEEGRTWTFEDEMLLQGDEELGDPGRSLVQERHAALQELIGQLDEIIQELESGILTPSGPANRDSLRALWRTRHAPGSWPAGHPPVGHPARWSVPTGTRRVPGVGLRRVFQSLGGYIGNPASSPPGMLRAASFPTWWVLGCHALPGPEEPPMPGEPDTPEGRAAGTPRVDMPSGVNLGVWIVVPDPDNQPMQYHRLAPTEPWPAAGTIFEVWRDSQGYYYLNRGQRHYLPGPPT